MIKGFWQNLKKPIYALAPMANVTDAAFRQLIAHYGKPDVMFTEFVSCDGLCSIGRDKLLIDFLFDQSQRPIVAQIFGSKPDNFYKTALLINELGFDGIDINMGCPDKTIEHQGAGAALINTPQLAQDIIRATQRGAGKLPVSIKTRIGYKSNTLDSWLPYLLETEPAAITIHARTRQEMSSVPAHWQSLTQAMEITQKYYSNKERPLILGNGDVENLQDADEKIKTYGVDGVMIGRGIFGNPWLFSKHTTPIITDEKLRVMLEHTRLFEKLFEKKKHFDIMKKHYKAYITGFEGAKELRLELNSAHSAAEVSAIVKKHFPQLDQK